MVKNMIIILLVLFCLNSCAVLEGLAAAGEALSFLDTFDERRDSEEKITAVIENKTDETLALFVLFSTDLRSFENKRGAELARLPAHTVKEIRITQGRKLRVTGGNTGIDYTDITCNQDGEVFAVYPVSELSPRR